MGNPQETKDPVQWVEWAPQRLHAKHLTLSCQDMHREWLAGFTDAEGCFCLSQRADGRIEPSFSITQHQVDAQVLHKVQDYLGVGRVYEDEKRASFRVRAASDLSDVVIPSFHGQLQTSKMGDYQALRRHMAIRGRTAKAKMSAEWLGGFVDGEGSFFIVINRNIRYRHKVQVRLGFGLSQTSSEKPVLDAINRRFLGGCAAVRWQPATNSYLMTTERIADIRDRIIPLFSGIGLHTRKRLDVQMLAKAVALFEDGQHLREDAADVFGEMRRQMWVNRVGRQA